MTTVLRTPITPLSSDIEAIVRDVPGWTPLDELFALALLVHASADVPGDIVEVGTWCGRSAVVLGQAAAETGQSCVHSIDPFPDRSDWFENADGSYSFAVPLDGATVRGYTGQTVWPDAFAASLAPVYATCTSTLEIFTRVLAERGQTGRVQPHRGTARTFARQVGPTFRCRLAFLDGDHGYDAVREDIRTLAPLLSPGAWICFDDAFSSYAGVNRAIEEEVLGNPRFVGGRQLTRKLFVARTREEQICASA